MDRKTINKICNYIKENPDCIIEYCDYCDILIYKKKDERTLKNGTLNDIHDYWDIDDSFPYRDGYISNMIIVLHTCAKKGIDISKIKIKSN